MSDTRGGLELTNAIGMRISVEFSSEKEAFEKQRALGRSGWGPMEVPAGGFRLPLALHDKFDWSLIGAHPLTIEGEAGVMFQGQFYKQRSYEEQAKGKRLPAAIKYSRGAKKTDLPHIIEEGSGDSAYVTLITFRGNGRSIPQFEVPAAQPTQTENRQTQQSPLRGEALADAQTRGDAPLPGPLPEGMRRTIETIIKRDQLHDTVVAAVVRECTAQRTVDFRNASSAEGAEIVKRLQQLRKGAMAS